MTNVTNMTNNGNEAFLKEQYKVGNSYYSDYYHALIESIREENSTNDGSNIEITRYWDFG